MHTFKTFVGNETTKLLWFIGAVVLLLGIELWITRTQAFMRDGNVLAIAITIDICCGIPTLYWLLVARPRQFDPITIAPAVIASVIVARFLLPSAHHEAIHLVEYGMIAVELTVVIYGGIKIRRVIKEYQHLRSRRPDFLLNLRQSLEIVFNGGNESVALNILASEISMMRYAFAWRMKNIFEHGKHSFSTHKKVQYSALFFTLLAVCSMEAIGVHILVALFWSTTAALVLTVFSAYTILFLVADYRAILQRPFVLEGSYLLVRTGIRWTADIPLDAIKMVRLAPRKLDDEMAQNMIRITPFGAPNVLLEFHTTQEIRGPYGIKREATLLGCSVDNAEEFVRLLQENLEEKTSRYSKTSFT